MDLKKKIDAIFPDYQKDLGRLVSIESVLTDDGHKPFGHNIQRALEQIITIAQELGYRSFIDPEGHYAYAEIGTGDEMFGVLGHMDVVPAGDKSNWTFDPFTLTEKDGYLFGRGTSDDKGPTLAAMYALKVLLDEGYELNQRVRFIFGGDEESLWRCMKAYVEKEEIPTKGFTPDSGFPLTYAEKGLIEFTLTTHQVSDVRLEGGGALNAVAARATTDFDEAVAKELDKLGYKYVVEGNDLIVIGEAIHAKDADKGKNAIVYLAQALHNAGKTNNMIRYIVEQLYNPNGKAIFGDVEDEVSGKLMLNVGKVEFKENIQEVGIDIRFPVTFPVETVSEKIKKSAHQYEVVVELYDYLKSIYIEKESDFIQTLMKAYQDVTGDMVSEPITSGGATYARAMDNVVAFGALLPTGLKTEHQVDERISIEDMKVAMHVYIEAFKNLVVK